eukprot:519052-Prymnesium_polylepis.1
MAPSRASTGFALSRGNVRSWACPRWLAGYKPASRRRRRLQEVVRRSSRHMRLATPGGRVE